jgi:hypothetical protein
MPESLSHRLCRGFAEMPCSIRCSGNLLGRIQGGETNFWACTSVTALEETSVKIRHRLRCKHIPQNAKRNHLQIPHLRPHNDMGIKPSRRAPKPQEENHPQPTPCFLPPPVSLPFKSAINRLRQVLEHNAEDLRGKAVPSAGLRESEARAEVGDRVHGAGEEEGEQEFGVAGEQGVGRQVQDLRCEVRGGVGEGFAEELVPGCSVVCGQFRFIR